MMWNVTDQKEDLCAIPHTYLSDRLQSDSVPHGAPYYFDLEALQLQHHVCCREFRVNEARIALKQLDWGGVLQRPRR